MKPFPRTTLILLDTAALLASLWLAYQIRFDFLVPPKIQPTLGVILLWVVGLKLLFLWRFRQFEMLLGYFSLSESSRLFWALLAPSLLIFVVSSQFGSDVAPPRSVVVTDFGFSLIALTAIRVGLRGEQSQSRSRQSNQWPKRARRAGIIGAGLVGTALAREFVRRHDLGLRAVAFFDD